MGRYPFPPNPVGWFAVGISADIAPGDVVSETAFGRELVIFRTESGELGVVDAHCPHMGAHFGHGGTVAGEALVCPFHKFEFDRTGACISTPYEGKVPGRCKLGAWPVREQNGFVLVWFHPNGDAPDWEVPTVPFEGWTGLRHKRYRIKTHCQEATENSVDLGHFSAVHGYQGIQITRPLKTEGPLLTICYEAKRDMASLGMPGQHIDFTFDIQVWGLGWSFVEVDVATFGISSRQYVLATPADDDHIDLRIATHMTELPSPEATAQLSDLVFEGYQQDVEQDVPIWENKLYVDPPALGAGDGPIGPYRQWCKRFYVE